MTNLSGGASLPTDAVDPEAELSAIDQKIKEYRKSIKFLLAEEDFARGVFRASAIHDAKQAIMALHFQRIRCTNRRARRRASGIPPQPKPAL